MDDKQYSLRDIFTLLSASTSLLTAKEITAHYPEGVQGLMTLADYIAASTAAELTIPDSMFVKYNKGLVVDKDDVIQAMRAARWRRGYPYDKELGFQYAGINLHEIKAGGAKRKTRKTRKARKHI